MMYVLVVKDDPTFADTGAGAVVIATIFAQVYILREIRDYYGITISA